jgi:hypothetical protein
MLTRCPITAALPWPTAEPAHAQQNEQALLPSLNRSLNEYTFHTLAVVASGIQRVLTNVVAIPLKPVNAIQIDNLCSSLIWVVSFDSLFFIIFC